MTLPASGEISITDIVNELDYAILPTPIGLKSDLYNTANTGGGTGLMYHNLNMASNGTTSAKVAIYDPLTANADMTMSNWYNYARDIGMVMTYLITNNSSYDVNIQLVIWDTNNSSRGNIFNSQVNANSNTGTQTVNTGLLTITDPGGSMSSGYRIAIQNVSFVTPPVPPPPFPPSPPNLFTITITIDSASDTDGVGAGTTRTVYGTFQYDDQAPGGVTTPFPAKVVDTSGSLIYVNKRTTVSITIS